MPSPERDVSRNHVEVILEGWHVLIRDLGTTNGTTVDPARARARSGCAPTTSRSSSRAPSCPWPTRSRFTFEVGVVKKGAPPKIPGLVFVQPLGSGGYADVFLYEQQSPAHAGGGQGAQVRGADRRAAPAVRRGGRHDGRRSATTPTSSRSSASGTSDDGRPYLVMKYYPPPNLAMRARAERFSVEEVLRTGIQLASAVETAHRAHITHRDIKPANVLISAYGAPGLTDFGIAGRGAREGDVEAEATDDVGVSVPVGAAGGALRPEQRRRALRRLLPRRHPVAAARRALAVRGARRGQLRLCADAADPQHRRRRATGRQDVPAGLERLLAQAMAKDPAHRPATALEFARALQAVEQEQRLARTPIVVLDEQGHTTLVSQTAGLTDAAAAADDEDRTRIKAPQTVVAQPVGALADDGRRRDASSLGGRRSALVTGPACPARAGRRAAAAPVRPRCRHRPGRRATPRPLGSGLARRRRRFAVPRAPPMRRRLPAPARRRRPRRSPGPRSCGGSWPASSSSSVSWSSSSCAPGPTTRLRPGPSRAPTVSMPGDDSAIGDGVFDKPTVSARSGAGNVSFTWNYPQPTKKDTFQVSSAPPRPMPGTRTAPSSSRSRRGATRSRRPRAPRCARPSSWPALGQTSPGSDVQCETAQ